MEGPVGDVAAAAAGSSGDAAAEGSQSSVVLSFREHMWDQFELLWRKRVEPTRRQLEVYATCVRERAQLERHYAKGLERIVGKIEGDPEQGTLPVALEVLACNSRARLEQSLQLADELEQEVAMTVDTMLKQHAEVSKLMFADGQKLTRHWQEAHRSHEQLAARYAQVCTDAEECAKDCMTACSLRPSDWKRLAERSVGISRHAAGVEREYYKAVQRLNSVMEVYGRHMGGLLGSLQDMEEKRARCFQDAAMKIAIFETSWLRNVQYDVDSAVQGLESVDAAAELQDFIQQHQSKALPPSKVSVRSYRDLPVGRQATARGPPDAPTAQQLEALRPICKALLSPGFDGALPSLKDSLESILPRFRGEAPASQASPAEAAEGPAVPVAPAAGEASGGPPAAWRSALCTVLREEIQDRSSVSVSSAALDTAVSLFTAALDGCDRSADAWCGRDLMVLAQKLQCQSEDGRTVDVLLRVYNHPLWSRVTFWEDVLLVGIAEAHCLQSLGRSSAAAGTETPEAAMTGFLQRYVSYMVALGIKQDQAQGCVTRTLRKHAQLLGPSAEVYIELLRSSAGTTTPAAGGTAPSASATAPAASAASATTPAASAPAPPANTTTATSPVSTGAGVPAAAANAGVGAVTSVDRAPQAATPTPMANGAAGAGAHAEAEGAGVGTTAPLA